MPAILELFLSYKIVPIIFLMYLAAIVLVVLGFKIGGVERRKDVIIRSSLMHGTYIFLSHALGIMFYSIMLIIIRMNGWEFNDIGNFALTGVSMSITAIIYIYFANYLWLRVALSKNESKQLIIKSLIFVIPWYFVLNLL